MEKSSRFGLYLVASLRDQAFTPTPIYGIHQSELARVKFFRGTGS
jgi:hypothetical protein